MLPEGMDILTFALIMLIGLGAGFVKGAIGFALPLILVSGLSMLIPVHEALGVIIVPILIANLHQALRQGVAPALASGVRFWRYIVACLIGIAISAPFVVIFTPQTMFLILGSAVLAFSLIQLSGWQPEVTPRWRNPLEWGVGSIAGLCGGLAGTWGPPTVLFLLAIKAEKREMVRMMSAVFALGGVALALAHARSGVLNISTGALSVLIMLPVAVGMWFGYKAQDRMDAALFRKLTLILLCVSALNLLRRGLLG